MEEQQPVEQCPLVTSYATSSFWERKLRPFDAIDPALLEKLYIIRKWPVDPDNPDAPVIPFKRPSAVREYVWNTAKDCTTDKPLIIKEFQKQAIHHLIRMPRFILGDAVGLGKTLDALVAFAWLKERNPDAKMVVVTTKSTTYQWLDECRRFTTLNPYVMKDSYKGLVSSEARYLQMVKFFEGKEKDILIVKYDSLKGTRKVLSKTTDEEGKTITKREEMSEETRMFGAIFKQHRGNLVLVLDECHRFKSEWTQTRNLIWVLCRYPERVWALTATVIKNGMDEFYSIATAVGVRPLGWLKMFHDEYCRWRDQHVGQGRYKKVLIGYENVPQFKREMRPFFFGRSQRQVKEKLPRLTTIYHPIDLDPRQTKILTEDLPNGTIELPPILFKVAGEWREKERDPENMMTQLSVQQLVTNHWGLLDRNDEKNFLTKTLSPKEEALLDMLDGDYRGEKVVVYTKYRSWIDRLDYLTKNGQFTDRKFLRITGAENEKKRGENKALFQDPDSGYDLIVVNAAGIEGINLQQAAHMICLDVPWSWGDLIQLVGRMVRMASPHAACTLHIMVAKGTIDEFAIETLKGKKGVFETILGESHSAGILDGGDSFDLDSGMETVNSDNEFKAMLEAHVKKVGMKNFLGGREIAKAQSDIEYKMVFERGNKKKKSKRHEISPEEMKWFTD
jgi:SNF2 family DNA or RNA helicase